MNTGKSLIKAGLKAVTVVTNCWQNSVRFYRDALAYQLISQGQLTESQRYIYGNHLIRYALFGHQEGSVVRLIETNLINAIPNRLGAKPWDTGMAVFEAGTPDVDRAYRKVLEQRFGAISAPVEFEVEGPEPLGQIVMKSTAFIGPAGEQIFVTQIVRRKGGISLLNESAVEGINTPANLVISMQDRKAIEDFWKPVLGIKPLNDLPLIQPEAALIMGGPADMGFDMLLMGNGVERIGMEQHIYEKYNPGFKFKNYPCFFHNTGLVSAAWECFNLSEVEKRIRQTSCPIIGEVALPLWENVEPKALVFIGPLGEIIELVEIA